MPVKQKKKKTTLAKVLEESFDLDPRRQIFMSSYMDPLSDTFGNVTQSGIKAGFTATYAKNLVANKTGWVCRIMEKMNISESVKRNIKKHLDLNTSVVKIDRKTKKKIIKEDAKLLKIQQDMTIFVAEKLIPEYKKVEKNPFEGLAVEIKQIIVMPPNANREPKTIREADGKTISSVPEAQ